MFAGACCTCLVEIHLCTFLGSVACACTCPAWGRWLQAAVAAKHCSSADKHTLPVARLPPTRPPAPPGLQCKIITEPGTGGGGDVAEELKFNYTYAWPLPAAATKLSLPSDYNILNWGFHDWSISFDPVLKAVGHMVVWGEAAVTLGGIDVWGTFTDLKQWWAPLVAAGRAGLARGVAIPTEELLLGFPQGKPSFILRNAIRWASAAKATVRMGVPASSKFDNAEVTAFLKTLGVGACGRQA